MFLAFEVGGTRFLRELEGTLTRLLVTKHLARMTLERLGFWRTLQDLSGVRSETVDRAGVTRTKVGIGTDIAARDFYEGTAFGRINISSL